jgi:hypothetical protein
MNMNMNVNVNVCRSCRMILHEEDLEYLGATEQRLHAWRSTKGVHDAPLDDYLKECRAKLEEAKYAA